MSGAATSTSYSAYLKDIWPIKSIYNLVLSNNTLWGLLEKDTSWSGKTYNIPLGFGRTGGVGAQFNIAQQNKKPTSEADFALTEATFFSLFSVDRKVIRKSRNDQGAVKEALANESENAFEAWKRYNGLYLFRNGGGAIGVVSAVSGTTLTLTKTADIRNFERNLSIEFSSDDGSSSSPAGVRPMTMASTITAITRSAAQLTAAVNWTTICPGLTVGDYVFVQGTYGAVAKGLDAWLPASAPGSSDSFFNVNRSLDTDRLAGVRTTQTGNSPRNSAYNAAMEVFKMGGKPDLYVLGTTDFVNLQADLQSAGTLISTKMPAAKVGGVSFGIEYDAITFMGPAGPIQAVCDYNAVDGTSWMLTKDTWVIASIGDAPYFDDQGGGELLKEPTADSVEGRVAGDWQLGCKAPGYNARVTL